MSPLQFESHNRLLTTLCAADLALLKPDLEPVSLALRHSMEEANKPIKWAYFMESGIASVVAKSNRHKQVEAGMIGREGMTALMVVMGDNRSPNDTYIQVAGSAHRLDSTRLTAAMGDSPTLHGHLLRYAQAFMVQTTHTALANGTAKIEDRLARWLLMTQDRVEVDDLPLTHEFLSLMLAVRRPGVTEALKQLETRGLIRRLRASIRVVDREGLIESANGCYGVPEAEYARLFA